MYVWDSGFVWGSGLFHWIPAGCAVVSQVTPSADLRPQGLEKHSF